MLVRARVYIYLFICICLWERKIVFDSCCNTCWILLALLKIVYKCHIKHIQIWVMNFFNSQQSKRSIGCKIGFVNARNRKISKEEYSGRERINWKKLLGYDTAPEYCLEGLCIRAAIEELRCNWSNKKLGLPHENDLAVGRSWAFSAYRGTEKICRWQSLIKSFGD